MINHLHRLVITLPAIVVGLIIGMAIVYVLDRWMN
jgi:hypothetical protein